MTLRLLCCSAGYRAGTRMTGAACYDRNILAALASAGVSVDVVVPPGWILYEEGETPAGVTQHAARSIVPGAGPFARTLNLVLQCKHLLATGGPWDIYRFHSFASSVYEYRLLRAVAPPLPPAVLHFHHIDRNPVRLRILRSSAALSHSIITFSRAARSDLLSACPVPPGRVHVVYHGVEDRIRPFERDAALAQRLGAHAGEVVFLFLGSLDGRKNPLWLVERVCPLLTGVPGWRLFICGEGPDGPAIQKSISSLNLENRVRVIPPVSEGEKPALYNLADAFLFPSALEGFGLVIAEAMACGLPVVTFNTSAMPELAEHNVTGYLTKPFDAEEFAAAAARLIQDAQLRERMGARARDTAERRFKWQHAAKATRAIYEDVVNHARCTAQRH